MLFKPSYDPTSQQGSPSTHTPTLALPCPALPAYSSTWRLVAIHLFIGHGHDRVLKLLTEVRDGLVDQEDSHSHEQQVDEDKQDREDVLQAGLAEAQAVGGRLAVQA